MKVLLMLACICILAAGFVLSAQATRTRDAELRVDSIQAVMDTTRLVALSATGDTARAWERRAVQAEIEQDGLSEALRVEERARTEAEVRVRSLRAAVAAQVVVEEDGDRQASFRVRQEPYTVIANVTLPAPPEEGRLGVSVFLDSLRLTTRIGCRDVEGGSAQAVVVISGPEWVALDIQNPAVEPGVCNPLILPVIPTRSAGAITHVLAGALGGAIAGRNAVSVVAGGGLGYFVHRMTRWLPFM